MIPIKKNSVNTVTCTLFEKKKYNTSIYLFEFTNKESGKAIYTIATDLSSTTRFNQFCIKAVSGSTADPLQSQIKFILDGQYLYNVYENPLSAILPTGLHLVESGRTLVYEDSSSTPPPTYTPEAKPVLTVYNKNQS